MTVIIHVYGGPYDGRMTRTGSNNYKQGEYIVSRLSRPTLQLIYKYKAREPWNGESHVNVFLIGTLPKTENRPPKQSQPD